MRNLVVVCSSRERGLTVGAPSVFRAVECSPRERGLKDALLVPLLQQPVLLA